MITKAELDKMVDEEAQKVSYENDMPYTSARNAFRSGASFVAGILMNEIEKLEKEIDRVIEGYIKDIKVCSDAIRVDLDQSESTIKTLEGKLQFWMDANERQANGIMSLKKELSKANAEVESLKIVNSAMIDTPAFNKMSDELSEAHATIQSLKDERDSAIKAMDYHINSDMRTQEENQSLKDENKKFREALKLVRDHGECSMIDPCPRCNAKQVLEALTHKAEE